MKLSNRTLAIIAGSLVTAAILHLEFRVSQLAEQVDNITSVLIKTKDPVKYTQQELDCLTRNIYYEARGEPVEGQYAVAHVTINRLRSGKWGNSICDVVYAKKQFSWTRHKRLRPPDAEGWAQAQAVATDSLNGTRVRGLEQGMFFHATHVNPVWVDPKHLATQIGQHVFYNRAREIQ